MCCRGLEPDVVSHSSALSACEDERNSGFVQKLGGWLFGDSGCFDSESYMGSIEVLQGEVCASAFDP